jgi:hypothetical protein
MRPTDGASGPATLPHHYVPRAGALSARIAESELPGTPPGSSSALVVCLISRVAANRGCPGRGNCRADA